MDHMEFSIALPPLVELTNAGVEWNTMKQRLFTHLNPTTNSNLHRGTSLRRPFLISIAAEQVQGIFNMYNVSFEEASKFSKILQNIEDLCLPRFLIIYNRFRFFTCKQNGPEFNGFLQQLLAWSDLCEFGDLKDILLKDCIISGISEESVRQHLLRTEQLDFYKTVDICRAILEKKQSLNSNDLAASNKLLVDASINTFIEDPPETQKFSVATNTLPQIEDKGIQTQYHFNLCPKSADHNNGFGNHTFHELKPVNLVDESCDQELAEVHLPEPVLAQVSHSHTEVFSSDFNKHHSNISNNTSEINLEQNCVNSFMLGDTEVNPSSHSQVLWKSFNNGKPHSTHHTHVHDNKLLHPQLGRESDTSGKEKEVFGNNVVSEESEEPIEKNKQLSSSVPPKNARLRCRVCKISFNDLPSLRKHRKTHEGEKKYCCDVCSAKFFNASHLKVHRRLHTGERPFVCDVCGESYIEASKLKAHSRKHTGERPYECDICHMTFTWSAAFKRHKRIHTGEKPYSCDFCGSAFADFTALQRHTRTHTKEKPHKCDVCGYRFGDPSALRTHQRIHTGERPYICKFCGASFTRPQHVKEHMKLHLGQKPFKCDVCGATFVESSKLKTHMRRHTGEKPYQCKVCHASFAWTAAYTRHMRTHMSEKPYHCEVCGCNFAYHSTLIRHHRTHTGERPYQCKLCGSRFADSSSLSRHQRIHSEEKAFTCEVCGASFAVKSYLSRHIRIHTGEKPYQCDKCDSKFSDSSKLKRHQKIHKRATLLEVIQQHQHQRGQHQQHNQQRQQIKCQQHQHQRQHQQHHHHHQQQHQEHQHQHQEHQQHQHQEHQQHQHQEHQQHQHQEHQQHQHQEHQQHQHQEHQHQHQEHQQHQHQEHQHQEHQHQHQHQHQELQLQHQKHQHQQHQLQQHHQEHQDQNHLQLEQQQQKQHQQHFQQQQHLPSDNIVTGSHFLTNLSLRHDLPHFQEEDIFNHFSKPTATSFDPGCKADQTYDHIHGHDLAHLSFPHPHDECLDLKPSVSATLGITPGMDSFANILSFDT